METVWNINSMAIHGLTVLMGFMEGILYAICFMHWQATTGNLLHLLTFLQNMSTKKMVLTIQLMLTASFSLLMQHQGCLHLKHLRHIHNNTASHHLITLYLGKIYLLLLLIPVLLHRTRIQQDSKATDARRE